MAYLFTPPQRLMTVLMEGSLRYSYPVSSTVWKDANGNWVALECPPDDILVNAQQVLYGGAGRPVVIPDSLAAEIQANGVWQYGDLTQAADYGLNHIT